MGDLLASLQNQLDQGRARLHMPGHKGRLPYPLTEAAPWDMTELPATDSLYEADGCLLALERRLSRLYGAADTLLSAGGSTLGVQTMFALAGAGTRVACDRNIHLSALNAMGLLDIDPVWVTPRRADPDGIPLPPGPDDFTDALDQGVSAAYVTSPNYYGRCADISGIARAAHRAGVPLLVDSAHGAHLRFVDGPGHPISLGADACCDSLHKMLPALTGAAALHLGGGRFDRTRAKICMTWFGSTSPSYLILLSADLLADSIETGGLPGLLRAAAARLAPLRAALPDPGGDPLRLTIPARGRGAGQMIRFWHAHGIEPELCDNLASVLLCGAATDEEDFARLESATADLPHADEARSDDPSLSSGGLPERGMPLRQAMFAKSRRILARHAEGLVASAPVLRCPPGVPLVMSGEIIGGKEIFLLEKYGVDEIDVVK